MIERTIGQLLAGPAQSQTVDVSAIVADVRARGDVALAAYAQRFGDPPPRRIDAAEYERAFNAVDADLRSALLGASERVEAFARAQRGAFTDVVIPGDALEIGHRIMPIESAGIYVPAGRHPLPSSLLMGAIPARVAGVRRRVVCTPRVDDVMLAAAYVAQVTDVYEVGGAHAITALAYGTQTIPRVDLIVGPGNAYVTAAKRAVFGACGIDALAGPSEIAIVASGDAAPDLVAADLLAQAEHDDDARAVLLTDDRDFARRTGECVERRLETLATGRTARSSMDRNGGYALVEFDEIPALCNRLAPEHLSLHGARAQSLADAFHAYGTLFIGAGAAEVFGDYGSGPNHILPTNGSARFTSGLSVLTFLTFRTYERSNGKSDRRIANDAAILASAEGLAAHRDAALARML